MSKAPAVRQFAGDIRLWQKDDSTGQLVPVIADTDDLSGNQPIETNALTFSYQPGDKVEVVSKRRDSRYNQPVYSDTQPGTTSVSLAVLELPPLILARILFGEGTGAVLATGSVTDQPLAIPTKDVPLQLPHRLIKSTPAPVVKNGGVTLVANTDYVIDYRRGQIIIKAAAVTIADPDVTISYSYEAQVSTSIVGGATPTKAFYLTGDMEDRVSNENGELRVPQAKLSVDGDVDWLSSSPITATLTGVAEVAAGEDAPYTFVAYKQSA
jgi:hypothetical protein